MKTPRLGSLSNAEVKEFLAMVDDGMLFKWSLNYLRTHGREEAPPPPSPSPSLTEAHNPTDLDKELALRFEKLKASWAALEKRCPEELGQRWLSDGGVDGGRDYPQTGKAEGGSIFRNPVMKGKGLLLEVDADSLPPDLAERFHALKQSVSAVTSPLDITHVNPPTEQPVVVAASKFPAPVNPSAMRATSSTGSMVSLISSASVDAQSAAASRSKREFSLGLPSIASAPSMSSSSSSSPTSSSGRNFSKPTHRSADVPQKISDGSSKPQFSKKAAAGENNQEHLVFSLDDVEKLLESFTQEIVSKQKAKLKETRFLHHLISTEDDLTFWSKKPEDPPSNHKLPTIPPANYKGNSASDSASNSDSNSDSEEISPFFHQSQGLNVKSLKRWNFI